HSREPRRLRDPQAHGQRPAAQRDASRAARAFQQAFGLLRASVVGGVRRGREGFGEHARGVPRQGRRPAGVAVPERGVSTPLASLGFGAAVFAASRTTARYISRSITFTLIFLIRAYQSIHVAFFRG